MQQEGLEDLVWLFVAMMEAGTASPSSDTPVPPNPEMLAALSSRHGLTCAEVESTSAAPQQDLLWVVDHVTAPPWAPMRAADCLVLHHAERIDAEMRRWLVSPGTKGLGRLVIKRLDWLEATQAASLVHLALREGTEGSRVRKAAAACRHEAVRAAVADAP